MYDPGIGRFMSQDPVAGFAGRPLSLHRFAYGEQNPVNRIDPSGLTAVMPPKAGIKEQATVAVLPPGCAGPIKLQEACLLFGGGAAGPVLVAVAGAVVTIAVVDAVGEWVGDTFFAERTGAQDKKLTPGEIKKLKGAGIDPEALKQGIAGKRTGGVDLYKDPQGNVVVKPREAKGPGEPTGVNINELP